MAELLTEASRIQQTSRRRVWRLIDNELFKDDNGEIFLSPRNLYTDNYTIPCWVAWIAGSPVDFDVRPSHQHDVGCDCHEIIKVNLTEEELKEKGFLRHLPNKNIWVCENIPEEFLSTKKVGKKEINDLLYRCMVAAGIPKVNRVIIRIGVCFNFMFYIDDWMGKVFPLELDKIYNENYWDEHVWY